MLELDYLREIADDKDSQLQYGTMIVYGALGAYLTLGFYTDFIAQRNLYTLLGSLILIQVIFVLA
jgi:hypothetical protein